MSNVALRMLAIRLPVDLVRWIKITAVEREMSQQDLIKEAVELYRRTETAGREGGR